MKEKKINILVIIVAVLVLLFVPIIKDYISKQKIEEISLETFNTKIASSESLLVYVGEPDKETTKSLRKMRDMTTNDHSYTYNVYTIKSSDETKELFGDKTNTVMYIDGDEQKKYTKFDDSIISEDVRAYLVGDIDNDNKSYKVAKDFASYKKIVKSDKVVMSVFGRETCVHCQNFKVVYNALANKYNLDVYYFDSDSYDMKEYSKIINMDLTVPAKCGSTGKDFALKEFSGTPLTIFTKKGKVVDCIGGEVKRASLIETLKSVSMISE